MIFSGPNLPKKRPKCSVPEPFKQVLSTSRDVILSGQICGLKLQRVFTSGDGCWLPMAWSSSPLKFGLVFLHKVEIGLVFFTYTFPIRILDLAFFPYGFRTATKKTNRKQNHLNCKQKRRIHNKFIPFQVCRVSLTLFFFGGGEGGGVEPRFC